MAIYKINESKLEGTERLRRHGYGFVPGYVEDTYNKRPRRAGNIHVSRRVSDDAWSVGLEGLLAIDHRYIDLGTFERLDTDEIERAIQKTDSAYSTMKVVWDNVDNLRKLDADPDSLFPPEVEVPEEYKGFKIVRQNPDNLEEYPYYRISDPFGRSWLEVYERNGIFRYADASHQYLYDIMTREVLRTSVEEIIDLWEKRLRRK